MVYMASLQNIATMSPSLSVSPSLPITNSATSTTTSDDNNNILKPLVVKPLPSAVAVYCGANAGTEPAVHHAASCMSDSSFPNSQRRAAAQLHTR